MKNSCKAPRSFILSLTWPLIPACLKWRKIQETERHAVNILPCVCTPRMHYRISFQLLTFMLATLQRRMTLPPTYHIPAVFSVFACNCPDIDTHMYMVYLWMYNISSICVTSIGLPFIIMFVTWSSSCNYISHSFFSNHSSVSVSLNSPGVKARLTANSNDAHGCHNIMTR